ncbi:MAG: hypothetical protein IPF65_07310 [Polaromonas sp.]|nr:hypothetical protein [Polaromonas sp.]
MRRAIEGLTFVDRNALDNEFFGVDEPNFLKCFEFVGDARSFDLAGSLIPCIEAAAQKTQARFVGAGLAGAPKLTERQADFIRCIAGALKPAGITPSNSGKFLEFCNIIFEAAGFHDAPERAMKYFMKNLHPEMKVRGYSL